MKRPISYKLNSTSKFLQWLTHTYPSPVTEQSSGVHIEMEAYNQSDAVAVSASDRLICHYTQPESHHRRNADCLWQQAPVSECCYEVYRQFAQKRKCTGESQCLSNQSWLQSLVLAPARQHKPGMNYSQQTMIMTQIPGSAIDHTEWHIWHHWWGCGMACRFRNQD